MKNKIELDLDSLHDAVCEALTDSNLVVYVFPDGYFYAANPTYAPENGTPLWSLDDYREEVHWRDEKLGEYADDIILNNNLIFEAESLIND